MQISLDKYTKNEKTYRCPICGKEFKTFRGVNIHIAKAHKNEAPPEGSRYPGETVSVRHMGNYTLINICIRRSLYNEILQRAIAWEMPLEDLIYEILVDLAAFGLVHREPEFQEFIVGYVEEAIREELEAKRSKPKYVS